MIAEELVRSQLGVVLEDVTIGPTRLNECMDKNHSGMRYIDASIDGSLESIWPSFTDFPSVDRFEIGESPFRSSVSDRFLDTISSRLSVSSSSEFLRIIDLLSFTQTEKGRARNSLEISVSLGDKLPLSVSLKDGEFGLDISFWTDEVDLTVLSSSDLGRLRDRFEQLGISVGRITFGDGSFFESFYPSSRDRDEKASRRPLPTDQENQNDNSVSSGSEDSVARVRIDVV